mgnify:CR=1 FL=1
MNGNLSNPQFRDQSMTKKGAMPIKEKFNGPDTLPESNEQNKFAANSSMPLPKPGFF